MNDGTWRADVDLARALERGAGPGAAVRLVIAVLGLACCITALLTVAALPTAVAARDARAVALTPEPAVADTGWRPQDSVGTAQFVAVESQWSVAGRLVRQTDLFAPDRASVPPPPGVAVFPGPGQIVLSPALADLLAAPDSAGQDSAELAGLIDGTVVGRIDSAGLLGPDELRFYRGTAAPSPPAKGRPSTSELAVGWGFAPTSYGFRTHGDRFGGPLTALLIAGGAVVVLVAGGLLGLLPRLGAVGRARSAVRLRLLGVSDPRLRRVATLRGALLAGAGAVLGIVGFLLLRAGDGTYFATDLTVPPVLGGLILVVAAGSTVLAARRTPAPPEPAVDGLAPPRPFGAQVIVLLTAATTLPLAISVGRHTADTGLLAMGTVTLAVVAVLGSVGVLVPWLADVTTAHRPALGDPREVRAVSRPFGAAAGMLTAVLVLQAISGASGRGGRGPLGARADLVATARIGTWVGAVLMVLLLLVGALLAADRVGPGRRLRSIVLVATGWGAVLAVPVAVTLTWLVGRAADLDIPASAVPVIAGAVGVGLLAAGLTRSRRPGPAVTTPGRS